MSATSIVGAEITFATSASLNSLNATPAGQIRYTTIDLGKEVEQEEVSHIGSTSKEFQAIPLPDNGQYSLGFYMNTDLDFDGFVGQANETIVITWPIPTGSVNTTKGTWTFQGNVANYTATGDLASSMSGTLVLQVSGDVTVVASSA